MTQKNNSKRLLKIGGIFALSAVLLVGFSNPTTTMALIDSTVPSMTEVSPPSDVTPGATQDSTQIITFNEKQRILLAADLDVDHDGSPGDYDASNVTGTAISAGTWVDSHYVHLDTVGSGLVELTGTVNFTNPIIGILVTDANKADTDELLGNDSTTYSGIRKLEVSELYTDDIIVSTDSKNMTAHWYTTTGADAVRVITESSDFLEKTLTDCDTVVPIKAESSSSCSFVLQYNGPLANVTDIIPAEWTVSNEEEVEAAGCEVESSNAGTPDKNNKKENRSATQITCNDVESLDIEIDLETRQSPSGKDKWKPTSCGLLYVNDGASAWTLNDGVLTTLFETDSLALLASNDPENDDCDADGLTDLEEFTGSQNGANGNEPTDPENPDSDGDGLSDYDEINIYASDPNDPNTTILDTALQGSPGGHTVASGEHTSTFVSYGDGGTCDAFSGNVFVLDNGYINVNAVGLLRSTDCIVPTPTHDFVDATLHCDEGDIGPTGSTPLSTNGGAATEGDFDITDNIGAIGTCTNPAVFVESTDNNKHLALSQ